MLVSPGFASRDIHVMGRQVLLPTNPYRIALPKGAQLRSPCEGLRFAHIFESGLVSTSIRLDGGGLMLARISGAGDIFEIDQLVGCHPRDLVSTVLVPGIALRVCWDEIKTALEEDRELRKGVFQTLGVRAVELEQLSICNCVHPLKQRLARHLLLLSHMSGTPTLPVTQEELAHHLGVSRSSIVVTADVLRSQGIINFRRGTIFIVDSSGLEYAACECYRKLRDLRQRQTVYQAA